VPTSRKPGLAGITAAIAAAIAITAPASAKAVKLTIKIENLAPANSISFAPLRYGVGNGTFDAFNIGQTATAPIISVAEGGSGSAWLPAFAAADPGAVLGSIGGALTPGSTLSSMAFDIDTAVNQFFTFASMVIPSNDLFIGNDDPAEYKIFDTAGNLLINTIEVTGGEIWNAGSEAADPLNAAFVVGGTNALRTPENGVVEFSFAELAIFNGLTTAAGYVFDSSSLRNTTGIYRISFSAQDVPEPGTLSIMALGFIGAGAVAHRRKVLRKA
jgi:PEP-CTERM motif